MKSAITPILAFTFIMTLAMALVSCSDSKSYADLLRDETKAINNFLADQKVISDVPADSVFITGEDAPFYRMDDDGNVYMKVIRNDYPDNKPKYNDLVYFRFTRYNLSYYENGALPIGEGNAHDVTYSESLRYANFSSTLSSAWGQGIQYPLAYLGYGCEVEIVVRSQYGRSDGIATVQPYLYRVRYYKSNI